MTFDGDQLSSEVARSRVERNVSNISGNLTQAFYRFQGRKLVHSLRISKGSTVFDLGSGSGFLKPIFEEYGAIYHGIDTDEKSVAMAQKLYGAEGFQCGYFPQDVRLQEVDLVISLSCIDEVPDPVAALKAIGELIGSSKGQAVIAVRNGSFPVYSLKILVERAGLKRPSSVRDASYGCWIERIEEAGLRIVQVSPYYRPWFTGFSVSGVKNTFYRMANWVLPTRYCYMLQFSLARP